jgi:glutathione synthase
MLPSPIECHLHLMPPHPSLLSNTKCKAAFDAYEKKMAGLEKPDVPRVIAMIVHEGEFNAMDQRLLEYALLETYGLETVRLTLKQIHDQGSLYADDALEVTLPTGRKVEIAVAYYRTGYAPRDYPTEAHWEARLLVEQSMALKCPNAAWHLAGTKKMQQVSQPAGVMRLLLPPFSSRIALII